jgi:transposase-like protein
MLKPAWYLKDVKEKENRDWPYEDKLSIYYLCKNHPVAEVAHKFNATKTQIHNITRLTRKSLKQQCYHCGDPLTEEEAIAHKGSLIKACNKCKVAFFQYKKERRDRALKQHMCGICRAQPVLKGHTACKNCISSTYRRRIRDGLCGKCGKEAIKEGALCKRCLT